jgi:NodT family efflux transporter outer membrane factor (OMF) lipoprotein
VLVTLLGDVASNYVQPRTFEQQLEYVRTNVKLQQETLSIAKAQFTAGQVTELDVDQAEGTLAITESQIPQLEIAIRQIDNRLCVLLGIPVEDLRARLGAGPIPTAPPTVAVGMPADLLRRRPDVRREERLAAAQCAEIGIAESDWYPAIAVTGQIGYAAQNFPQLFNGQAFLGSIGPSFQWNVLDYGRILNNVLLQNAKFQGQITKYQSTVLKADEKVEDGLVTFLKAHQRARAAAAGVKSGEKAVRVALAQYKGGTVDFNRVSLLEQNLVGYQDQFAEAQGQIALGLIQVYKALGGGWEIRITGCDTTVVRVDAGSPDNFLTLPPPRPASTPGGGQGMQTTNVRMTVAPSPPPDNKARIGMPSGY